MVTGRTAALTDFVAFRAKPLKMGLVAARFDTLRITGGLGPVPACDIELRPFTVFIGPQGVGKSLVAQAAYAIEDRQFLLFRAISREGAEAESGAGAFPWVLNRLRSPGRSLSTFANTSAKVQWLSGGTDHDFAFSVNQGGPRIRFSARDRKLLNDTARELRLRKTAPPHRAIFFPTERIVIPQLANVLAESLLRLPITYELFSHWLHEMVVDAVETGPTRPESNELARLGEAALAGSAERTQGRWFWQVTRKKTGPRFDLDLASSGQRANWSIPYVARGLLALRERSEIARDFTLYVEEPEVHLHPRAQHHIVLMLALLVNHGFRVVLTTHSLTVLYSLNNLIQASLLGGETNAKVPGQSYRLQANEVSVYSFKASEAPRQLVDPAKAFVDERPLSEMNDELSQELNRIGLSIPATP